MPHTDHLMTVLDTYVTNVNKGDKQRRKTDFTGKSRRLIDNCTENLVMMYLYNIGREKKIAKCESSYSKTTWEVYEIRYFIGPLIK